MARKSLGISAGLLSLAFLLGGCAISDVELWPPTPGTSTEEIYVSLDTWHAMIAFPQKNLRDHHHFSDMPGLKTPAAEQPAFEEWGYAERAWYLNGRQGLSDILRTLFWPTDGVVEIAAYNQVWADRTPQPPSDLFIFRISQEGYQRLRRHLRSTIISSDPIETVRNSRFFRAARPYHLFHHCHQYVALALQEAGLPISTFWAFNRSSLAMQLHRAQSLENEKTADEHQARSCPPKLNRVQSPSNGCPMHAIAGNGEMWEKPVTARVLHCLSYIQAESSQSPLNPDTSVTVKC